MNSIASTRARRHAFTLIELLVVIAVIGILAGMLLAIIPGITKRRMVSVGYSELSELQTAIEAYKAKYGFYPPDNPNLNVNLPSPLYFELAGSTNNGFIYSTLDGKATLTTNQILSAFGVNTVINSSTSLRGTDDRPAPVNFLKELKSTRTFVINGGMVLVCSEGFDGGTLGVWRYTTTHATNNPGSYDLFVDLAYDGKTNRISNWSSTPLKLP